MTDHGDPLIVGAFGDALELEGNDYNLSPANPVAAYWKRAGEEWTGFQMKYWDPGSGTLISDAAGVITHVNNRYELLGPHGLIQNQAVVDWSKRVSGWSVLGVDALNNSGALLGTARKQGETESKSVLLLPVEFKKMWETKNKVNQMWNPTPKDDPLTSGQQPNSVAQLDGVQRNKIYVCPDPDDQKYHVSLDVELAAEFRPKFIAAAYVGDTKVAQSDTPFPATGPVEIAFTHSGTSNDTEDFAIRIGYDANNSGTLDPAEQFKFSIDTHSDKREKGEAIVRGISSGAYDYAKGFIDAGIAGGSAPFFAPHASALLKLFRDGTPSSLPTSKQPTSSTTIDFNCFSGEFSEWLTHNSGWLFPDSGNVTLWQHTWDETTTLADLVSKAHQIREALRAHYSQTVAPLAASLSVAEVAYFPSATTFYEVPYTHESPSWVPRSTVNLSSDIILQGDDLQAAVGRGRLRNHQVRYKVEKMSPTQVDIREVRHKGEVTDLYDFNYEAASPAPYAAALQIGYGKGVYGQGRNTRGKIYRSRILFDVSWPLIY